MVNIIDVDDITAYAYNKGYSDGAKYGEKGWPERCVYYQNQLDKAEQALEACVNAMIMQEGRMAGDFHITQETAKYIWDTALEQAEKVLE